MEESRDWFSEEGTRHGEWRGRTLIIKRRGSTINIRPTVDGVEVTSILTDGTVAQETIRCRKAACAA